MHVTSVFVALSTFCLASHAAVLRQADPYVGDLRTFGAVGCFNDNQGVGTFLLSETSQCNEWPITFKSMYAHVVPGWTVHAYATADCSDEGVVIGQTEAGAETPVCNNNVDGTWTAYSVYPVA